MIIDKKTTFGVIVGTRGFFNSQLSKEGRRKLLEKLKKMDIEAVILPEGATPTGAIETIEDAKKCAKLFNEHRYDLDGIIISLPNFGDEIGVVNTLQLAQINLPILVHAADDHLDKVDVKNRRDAFCGKLSVCNNLYQYAMPFTETTNHTCEVESKEFTEDLEHFRRVCRVVQGLTRARIGEIGARPAPFQTVRASEKLLQDSGITVVPVDLSEIIAAAQSLDDGSKEVKAVDEELRDYGTIPDYIKQDNIMKQVKLSVAVRNWIEKNEIDAACIQCWTSIQENYGCAACATMSMLGEKRVPFACEVDVAGAVSMYALTLASEEPSALLDWNNNYGKDRSKCVLTHCSNYPKSFIQNDIEISNLDILGNTLGKERCFGAVKGKVAAGPMTFFRISTDDYTGTVKTYLGEGDFTDDPCDMDGGVAVAQVDNLRELLWYMTKNGFEHHVAMARTYSADIIYEAAYNYLDWDVYYHNNE